MLILKRIIYFFLAACSILGAHIFLFSQQSNFLVWALLALALVPGTEPFLSRLKTVFFTSAFALITVLIADQLRHQPYFQAVYFAILTGTLIYFGHEKKYLRAAIIILLITLSVLFFPALIWQRTDYLFYASGTALLLFLQIIEWPYQGRDVWQFVFKQTITLFGSFNDHIFACLLQPDYPNRQYLYENRLHMNRQALYRALLTLTTLTHDYPNPKHVKLIEQLRLLFSLMQNYAEIRYRVSDHTTFSLCEEELKTLMQTINLALQKIKFCQRTDNAAELYEAIKHFIANYHHILQVSAPEPLVFLLFIDSLKQLDVALIDLEELACNSA